MKTRLTNPQGIAAAQEAMPDEEVRALHRFQWNRYKEQEASEPMARFIIWMDKVEAEEGHGRLAQQMDVELPDDPVQRYDAVAQLGESIEGKVAAVTLLTQAWMAKQPVIPTQDNRLRPSQDPARMDALLASTLTMDGRVIQTIAKVMQDGNRWIILSENEDEEAIAPILEQFMAGWMDGEKNRMVERIEEKLQALPPEKKAEAMKAADEGRWEDFGKIVGL